MLRRFLLLLAVLSLAAPALAQTSMPMPSLGGPYNGNYRGYWFVAPTDFVITSLFVPGTLSNGAQNVQVLRMNSSSVPPEYSSSTTSHTSLFLATNDTTAGPIPTSITVNSGDVILVLGARGTNGNTMRNAYASSPGTFSSFIGGQSVTLTRLVYQADLLPAAAVSSDASGQIAVVELTYSSGPPVPNAGSDLSVNEGSPVTLAGSVAGTYTNVAWVFGDGTNSSGSLTPTKTWADDGVYTVTLSATNSFGVASDTATITVDNVAPTITSTPTNLAATENVAWSYQAAATDPGVLDTLSWSMGAGSPGWLTVTSGGLVQGTPPPGVWGSVSASVEVSDGDGGITTQPFTLTVAFQDSDGDGMSDSWESANGLNPSDATDGAGDGDADGLSNLEEFLGGTDPTVFDGPGAPTLVSPVGGAIVTSASPQLEFGPATDPQGDTLTYTVQVWDDPAMNTLVQELPNVLQSLGATTVVNASGLAENTTFAWRVRASDGNAAGPWTSLETFFVNAVNEAPNAPTLLFPTDGEYVDSLRPTLQWAAFSDVDQDTGGTFVVEVTDADGQLVTTLPAGAGVTSIQVDTDLEENTTYRWSAQAMDPGGLSSPWSAEESFVVDTTNSAPDAVEFIRPTEGEEADTTSPEFEATASFDVEGDAIDYEFEVDSSPGYDAGDGAFGVVAWSGDGTVIWTPGDEGVALERGQTWYARVRVVDERGAGSSWDEVSFSVSASAVGDDDDDDGGGGGRRRGCSMGADVAPGWLALVLLVPALRRRRRM